MACNFGLSYAYVDDVFIQQSGIGFMGKVKIDYMLNDDWGLGIETSILNSTFKKPKDVVLKENEKWGFSRMGYMFGVRYYF